MLKKVVDVLFTGVEVYVTYTEAKEAYERGDYEAAARTVSNGVLSEIGGAAITSAIAPYLVGFGTAIGGPVGAVVGAVLAGAIGFGAAYLISDLGFTIGNELAEILGLWDNASTAVVRVDPLILDIGDDGYRKYGSWKRTTIYDNIEKNCVLQCVSL